MCPLGRLPVRCIDVYYNTPRHPPELGLIICSTNHLRLARGRPKQIVPGPRWMAGPGHLSGQWAGRRVHWSGLGGGAGCLKLIWPELAA